MNYKEALFFVGKCLTISHEKENLEIVKDTIKNKQVNWDVIVQLSTKHYVFPALYCNLKRAELLSFLPEDLVSYMKHITDLNRERNQQIIAQAKEINSLLVSNGITPIFLKGTGFLLEGMYEDIAERMVGDIDFIVSKKDFDNTIRIIEGIGYSYVSKIKYHYPSVKHHPRIQNKGKIAAVEIHHEMTTGKYKKEFNYEKVAQGRSKNNIHTLSYDNQLSLTIIAKQINDDGQYYKNSSLRNSYDVFLLSKKVNSLEAIKNYKVLFSPLNNYLAISNLILNSKSIDFEFNTSSKKYLKKFSSLLDNKSLRKKHYKRWRKFLFIKQRSKVILKSFIYKDYRYWLIKRITDPVWYKEKMIQLGVKSDA